jgi:hypothetical protein
MDYNRITFARQPTRDRFTYPRCRAGNDGNRPLKIRRHLHPVSLDEIEALEFLLCERKPKQDRSRRDGRARYILGRSCLPFIAYDFSGPLSSKLARLDGTFAFSRSSRIPKPGDTSALRRGFDGLASSAGARWDQSAAIASYGRLP